MKKRYKIIKIITLLLYIVQTTCDEDKKKDIVHEIEQAALKKYPWLLNEPMHETVLPSANLRRHGSKKWEQDIEDRPLWYRYWYKNTQTFAYDLQYYVRSGGNIIKLRGCYMILTTTTGASGDMRRYYTMRYLFHDHIDFEIGYMTHEIIMKYQNLIELFHIARKKYFYNRHKNNAPTKYLFVKYMNMLETSNAIIHFCNMFHEIRFKFAAQGPNDTVNQIFNDAPIEENIAAPVPRHYETYNGPVVNVTGGDTVDTMEARLRRERNRKRKAIKLTDRWRPIFTPSPPYPTPYKSWQWPLIYGWSIEDW